MMDESRIDEIFEFIENIHIDLDYDPIAKGPKHLNKKIAECRNYGSRVQRAKREVLRHKRKLERKLNRKESEHELKMNQLLTNNDKVRSQSSKADRRAAANAMMADLNEEIQTLKLQLTDLEHVEEVIDSKLRELKDVNRDLRTQKRLIEDEIDTGAHWGDDLAQGASGRNIPQGEIDVDDIVEGGEETAPEDFDDLFDIDSSETSQDEAESQIEAIDSEPTSSDDTPPVNFDDDLIG